MSKDSRSQESVPFRMHPRVFNALGKELVTNDVVAVIELVKNAYDAFAQNVWLEFLLDDGQDSCLEIRDDGLGMTRQIIEDVWCMVATPFRESHPYVWKDNRKRRVVGAKGLGRLAVARLGRSLTMLTQAAHEPCWEVIVDWADITQHEDIAQSAIICRPYLGPPPFPESGTLLRIRGLAGGWETDRIDDLRENLSRLLSPFAVADEFQIFVSDGRSSERLRVESSPFLAAPKYSFQGKGDNRGNVTGIYEFTPLAAEGTSRREVLNCSWQNIRATMPAAQSRHLPELAAGCGQFEFEIRAWDIGSNDTQEISERFAIQKSLVRSAIRANKGLSVYRDGVLVLPKSDAALDWLGLDLRRVTQVGRRLSTSQIVGYVAISAEHNPKLKDTSDRESLMSCLELDAFKEILRAIVKLLENERAQDRARPRQDRPMADLFGQLTASELVSDIIELADKGNPISDAIPLIQTFSESLEESRQVIQERFVYYSRLATVGTIAHMLVHEIRNRTTAFGDLLKSVKSALGLFQNENVDRKFARAQRGVEALDRLADTFLPLASRTFQRRRRNLILEDQFRECLTMNEMALLGRHIRYRVPLSKTTVNADPAEIDTVILNLITNAIYWLGEVPKDNRTLEFELKMTTRGDRVQIWVHDSGPGIRPDDLNRVFLPGVTRKPGGIGMGLNVASELVAIYGGEMKALRPPTHLGGASFTFDLPLAVTSKEDSC